MGGLKTACHLVFNRYEPVNPLAHMVLLGFVPGILTTVLLSMGFSSAIRVATCTFCLYYSTILTSILAYRLSPFHPLAKYPGPIPMPDLKVLDGLGPNELSFRDPNLIAPILGYPGRYPGLPKGPHWDGRMAEQTTIRALISLRDPAEHARRRKPWTRAFSTAALKGYEEILAKRVHELVAALEKQQQPLNLVQWISHFTFDFMSDMAFGGGSEMVRDGDKDDTWHLLESGLPLALILSHVPWLGQYYIKLPNIGEELKKFRSFCQERAMLRRLEGSHSKDLFHYLIDESGVERSPPTFGEVASDGVLAIVAGSDTTATTLSSLFWGLLHTPTAYRRLQAEIDYYYPFGEDASSTVHHHQMSYLNAVMCAILLYFFVKLDSSHRGVPKGGRMLGSSFVPEGTSAFVHTYSLHRDPRYFSPMPDTFWPERWLSDEQRRSFGDVKPNDLDKAPFKLACQEMRTVVCAMMQHLEFRFASGYDPKSWDRELKDYFVATKGKLPVVLSPRTWTRDIRDSDCTRL
ncbi:cytochrome P450 [Melanogaster broomeanus]|nr:cytochrome P450 [Melanogaster broomeanus]